MDGLQDLEDEEHDALLLLHAPATHLSPPHSRVRSAPAHARVFREGKRRRRNGRVPQVARPLRHSSFRITKIIL